MKQERRDLAGQQAQRRRMNQKMRRKKRKRMKMENKRLSSNDAYGVCVCTGNCFAKNVNSSAAPYWLQYKNCTDFCIAGKILCRENTFFKMQVVVF